VSVLTKRVPIVTNGSGVSAASVRLGAARLLAIDVALGTLSTPDITITEQPANVVVMAVAGLAASTRYNPSVALTGDDGAAVAGAFGPYVALGRLDVAIAGGGATKIGELTFTYET
jgi:hypothetical protein